MKKVLSIILLLSLISPLIAVDLDPFWDGLERIKITRIDVTGGENFGFRVYADSSDLLNDTDKEHRPTNWAYINESDSNYKTFVALLTTAYTLDYTVQLRVIEDDRGFAKIHYIVIEK